MNLRESVWRTTPPKDYENHIAEKRFNSSSTIWCANLPLERGEEFGKEIFRWQELGTFGPNRRWNSHNCLEETNGVRKFILTRDQLVWGEDVRGDLQGNSEKSQPIDETKDDAEAHHVITSNFEFNSTCRKEETFPIPLKYIDVSRTTQTNLDVMQESRIDGY